MEWDVASPKKKQLEKLWGDILILQEKNRI